ncbi:MAG: carboxymuconolactone decarboxylase family protein [Polyangiaceae bacterium]
MEPQSASLTSDAFQLFLKEAPAHAEAWMTAVQRLSDANSLDEKTRALVYIGILAALRLESGLPFHVAHAQRLGATRSDIISAILTGLPAAGMGVLSALPAAMRGLEVSGANP